MLIRAAVCKEFGQALVLEDINIRDAMMGEVRVKLHACAICHSDLSYADGIWGGTLPAVYGHEGAGIVESVGEGVTNYAVGDHVIVTLIRHCNTCHYCEENAQVLCEGEFGFNAHPALSASDGSAIDQAMNCGAFAQMVLVDQSQLQKVPQDMPFDVASLLACGVITGYGAVTHASDLKAGEHAIVIGCGGVGFNSLQAASLKGAASVIAMDIEPDKRELALEFGATHTIDPTSDTAADEVMSITNGRGADHVFVTVGAKSAIDSAQSYITKNGAVVIVGMPASGTRGDYDPGTMAAWGQKFIGTKMGNSVISIDIPQLLEFYAQGKYKLDELISGRFKLEEVNQALDGVRKGKAIKNILIFD